MNNWIKTKNNILFGQNGHFNLNFNQFEFINTNNINGNWGLLTLTDVWGKLRYWIGEGVIRNSDNNVIGNININENTILFSIFNEDDSFNIFWINNDNILKTLKIKDNILSSEIILFSDVYKFNIIQSYQTNKWFIIANNKDKWFVKLWNNLNNQFDILAFDIREQVFNNISYSNDGYFLFSPNGNKWINLNQSLSTFQLFSFDICTGKITFLNEWFNQIHPYEKIINFEWLNNDVFISILNNKINCVSENAIYKFNINNGIINSENLILLLDGGLSDLVLLSDNKIWITKKESPYLIWLDQNLNYDLIIFDNLISYGKLPKFISNRNIGISQNTNLYINEEITEYCNEPNIEISLTNTNNYTIFKWYKNGNLIDNQNLINRIINEDGEYWIRGYKLTGTNNQCNFILSEEEYTDKFIIKKYESKFNNINLFTNDKTDYCIGELITSNIQILDGNEILNDNQNFINFNPNTPNPIKRKIQWYKNEILILEDYETINLLINESGNYYVIIIEEHDCQISIKSNTITIREIQFNIILPEIKLEIPNCINNLTNIKYYVEPIDNYYYNWFYNETLLSSNSYFYPYIEGEYKLNIKYINNNCYDEKDLFFSVIKDKSINYYIISSKTEFCFDDIIDINLDLIYSNDMIINDIKWYKNDILIENNHINDIGIYHAQFLWNINNCNVLLKTNEITIKKSEEIIIDYYIIYKGNKLYNDSITILENDSFYIYVNNIQTSLEWSGDINNLIEETSYLWKYENQISGNYELIKIFYNSIDCDTCYKELIINITVIENYEPKLIKQNESYCNNKDGSIYIEEIEPETWDILWSNGERGIIIENLSLGNYWVKIKHKSNPHLNFYLTETIDTDCTNNSLPPLHLWTFNSLLCDNQSTLLETNYDSNFIFTWYHNNKPIDNGINSNTLMVNEPGDWFVIVNPVDELNNTNIVISSNTISINKLNWSSIKPYGLYKNIKYFNTLSVLENEIIELNIEGLNDNWIIIETNVIQNFKVNSDKLFYWTIKHIINSCQKTFYFNVQILNNCIETPIELFTFNLNEQLLNDVIYWYYEIPDCSNEFNSYEQTINIDNIIKLNSGYELIEFISPVNGNLLITNHPFEGWLVANGNFNSNTINGMWINLIKNENYIIPMKADIYFSFYLYDNNLKLIEDELYIKILNYKLYENNNIIYKKSNQNYLFIYKKEYVINKLANIINNTKIYLNINN